MLNIEHFNSSGSRISRRGGADLVGWAPTPKAATFWKICMSKRKNLDRRGARRQRPLDPPLLNTLNYMDINLDFIRTEKNVPKIKMNEQEFLIFSPISVQH